MVIFSWTKVLIMIYYPEKCIDLHISAVVGFYTQSTVKLRSNVQKIAQLKCTANEKRNLSEHDEKNSNGNFFCDISNFSIYRVETALK